MTISCYSSLRFVERQTNLEHGGFKSMNGREKILAILGMLGAVIAIIVVTIHDNNRDCSKYRLTIAGSDYSPNWSGTIHVDDEHWKKGWEDTDDPAEHVSLNLKGPAPSYFIRLERADTAVETAQTPFGADGKTLHEGKTVIKVYAIGKNGTYPSEPTFVHTVRILSPYPHPAKKAPTNFARPNTSGRVFLLS